MFCFRMTRGMYRREKEEEDGDVKKRESTTNKNLIEHLVSFSTDDMLLCMFYVLKKFRQSVVCHKVLKCSYISRPLTRRTSEEGTR